MPGFALAKVAADAFERDRAVEGLILHKHGIFTFGADAREAYERMIEHVTLAEERLKRGRKVLVPAKLPSQIANSTDAAPILRGACALKDEMAEGAWTRMILDFRSNDAILNFVNGAEVARYSQAGVVTPDHTIRTKNWPLIVPAPEAGKLDAFRSDARAAVASFITRYQDYFAAHNTRLGGTRTPLDPAPRVVLVPGLGLFGLGGTAKDAAVAADLAEAAIATILDAEAIGRFASISEADMFDMEYWPPEQAKLGKAIAKPLEGQIVAVTRAGGGIGAATARAFAGAGAAVALLDPKLEAATAPARAIGGPAGPCDGAGAPAGRAAFDQVATTFGGLDILVSNAGATPPQGKIGAVDEAVLRASFELNFYGHQRAAQAAVQIM